MLITTVDEHTPRDPAISKNIHPHSEPLPSDTCMTRGNPDGSWNMHSNMGQANNIFSPFLGQHLFRLSLLLASALRRGGHSSSSVVYSPMAVLDLENWLNPAVSSQLPLSQGSPYLVTSPFSSPGLCAPSWRSLEL